MQKYNVGDVVNLYCPNKEDRKLSTFRPVIIVEDLENEAVIIFITKQLHQQKHYPNSFIVNLNTPESQLMGLTEDSLICPNRCEQVRKIIIHPPPRGKCPEKMIEKILDIIEENNYY